VLIYQQTLFPRLVTDSLRQNFKVLPSQTVSKLTVITRSKRASRVAKFFAQIKSNRVKRTTNLVA